MAEGCYFVLHSKLRKFCTSNSKILIDTERLNRDVVHELSEYT